MMRSALASLKSWENSTPEDFHSDDEESHACDKCGEVCDESELFFSQDDEFLCIDCVEPEDSENV